MKSSQRKKIIIGYRYNPECYSSQRLHQVQTIQDQYMDEYLPIDSVKKTFESDQKLIQRLKNQNLLLKTQLQRMQQKSSFKSYQQLLQQYHQLQSQSNSLRLQIHQLRQTVIALEKRQKQQQERQMIRKERQEIDVRDDGRKFTFSSIGRENYMRENAQVAGKRQLMMRSQNIKPYAQQQLQQKQNINFINNEVQQWNAKFSKVTIDPDYMYNDLQTVQSQKSHQQLQSQIQLGYKFSFMPRPLKRNISALEGIENNNNDKKVTFNTQEKILFTSSSYKEMTNREVQTPNFATLSQQSLYGQQDNVGESIQGLNGLRKLPNKPDRNQRTSNYSINISDN